MESVLEIGAECTCVTILFLFFSIVKKRVNLRFGRGLLFFFVLLVFLVFFEVDLQFAPFGFVEFLPHVSVVTTLRLVKDVVSVQWPSLFVHGWFAPTICCKE